MSTRWLMNTAGKIVKKVVNTIYPVARHINGTDRIFPGTDPSYPLINFLTKTLAQSRTNHSCTGCYHACFASIAYKVSPPTVLGLAATSYHVADCLGDTGISPQGLPFTITPTSGWTLLGSFVSGGFTTVEFISLWHETGDACLVPHYIFPIFQEGGGPTEVHCPGPQSVLGSLYTFPGFITFPTIISCYEEPATGTSPCAPDFSPCHPWTHSPKFGTTPVIADIPACNIIPDFTISVKDVMTNTDWCDGLVIELWNYSSPVGKTLLGTAVTASGIATFHGFHLDKVFSGNTFHFQIVSPLTGFVTTYEYWGVDTAPFAVTANVATQLNYENFITPIVVNQPFIVLVRDLDCGGNPSLTTALATTIAKTGGLGTLHGTLVQTPVVNLATFAALSIDAAQHTNLNATASGLTGASHVLEVVVKFAFINQPIGVVANTPIPDFSVKIVDYFDITYAGADNLQLVIISGPGNLTGTTTLTPVAGVVTFTGVSLDTPGDYVLGIYALGPTYDSLLLFTPSDHVVMT